MAGFGYFLIDLVWQMLILSWWTQLEGEKENKSIFIFAVHAKFLQLTNLHL